MIVSRDSDGLVGCFFDMVVGHLHPHSTELDVVSVRAHATRDVVNVIVDGLMIRGLKCFAIPATNQKAVGSGVVDVGAVD